MEMINVENDLLSVLSKGGNKFSKGQRIIAKYILSNYDKAAFMTAGRLGKIVGVSESTVVRFAAELGYDGYPSMRKALQEMIRNRLTSVQRIEVAKSMIDDNDIVRSIIGSDIQNLQATLEILEQDSFNKFVDSIIEAKNIYIVGMRTSTSLSSFLGLYLNLLRSNVSVIHDTAASEVFEQIIRIGEGDLFIAISFPRYSSHTVDAMEFAKKMGAMTAAITDGPASPLNGIADVCLHAKSDMVSFLDSLVAPMSLINAIIIAVGIKNKENLSKTFERLETVWSENKVYEQTQHGGTT
ncbi:MAG: MurR/RpiR family transcriptional regulator [Firmicutes bacterium]|jgi:DNA-binding MurR/RpiR family transcriptional regulator|nr:MurR/RpiR family transcriptional regulator [Bacillota bacterium]